jgi:hypothetical protein
VGSRGSVGQLLINGIFGNCDSAGSHIPKTRLLRPYPTCDAEGRSEDSFRVGDDSGRKTTGTNGRFNA